MPLFPNLPPAPARAFCLAAALFAMLPGTAAGQEFCNEPVMPYCVDQYAEFDSTMEMDRCEQDLQAALRTLKEYEQCVKAKVKDLREELNEATKSLKKTRENYDGSSP